MQALILAGGEGTRLRPLTSTVPKPVVPLVDRPFIAYMLEWLRGHGVDDVILACGFMADGVRSVLGDGSALGVRLRYIEEPTPLGTGGALKYAEDLLDERFFMLNGDVLTDIDLTAQLRQHETDRRPRDAGADRGRRPVVLRAGAAGRGPGASASSWRSRARTRASTHLINAGAYILERDVLDGMAPAGTRISIEREVFPTLVGNGLFGYPASGYWMDIGTPERYLQATFEILEGDVSTEVGRAVAEAGGVLRRGGTGAGTVHGPALVGAGLRPGRRRAHVGARTVLGRGVTVGAGAHIDSSVVLDGATVGAGTRISRVDRRPRRQDRRALPRRGPGGARRRA